MRWPLFSAIVLFALCAPNLAGAQKPVPDAGRIELGPGWRYEPLRGSSSLGGAGRFSWHKDAKWFLGIELGAWVGDLDVEALDLEQPQGFEQVRVWVGDLRVALGAHLFQIGSGWFYAVGGGGYHVVGVTVDGTYHEGAAQGLFLGAGAYFPLGERVGVFIEDRWTLLARLRASVGQETPMIDAGGNLLWAGLVIFFEPEPRPGGIGR